MYLAGSIEEQNGIRLWSHLHSEISASLGLSVLTGEMTTITCGC